MEKEIITKISRLNLIQKLFFGILFLLFISCSEYKNEVSDSISFSGSTMGTTYTIKFVKNNDRETEAYYKTLHNQIDSILVDVNQKMSTYISDSELSKFNNFDSDKKFKVSNDLFKVVKAAVEIGKISSGALDITVGELVNLWGFGPSHKDRIIPSEKNVNKLKRDIGLNKLLIDDETQSLSKSNSHIYIDLSSIAKGYGVDKVADYLSSKGFNRFMVEIGGEVRTSGQNSEKSGWRIGIAKPNYNNDLQEVVELDSLSMATSGDYMNYFEENGVRYSHTIDPRTGKPITHKLASVSVIHKECMYADGFATALNVLGPTEGLKLAKKLKLPVLMIVREGDKFVEIKTNEFNKYLKTSKKEK